MLRQTYDLRCIAASFWTETKFVRQFPSRNKRRFVQGNHTNNTTHIQGYYFIRQLPVVTSCRNVYRINVAHSYDNKDARPEMDNESCQIQQGPCKELLRPQHQ